MLQKWGYMRLLGCQPPCSKSHGKVPKHIVRAAILVVTVSQN